MQMVKDARALEQATLWVVVGLLLALSISWAVYPRVYDHYHPGLLWHPEPAEPSGGSNTQTSFSLAILLAVLGFLQIGFQRWFRRDTSRFLFWVFLVLGLGFAFDYWTFALSTRFWTLTMQLQSDEARRAYETSNKLAPYLFRSMVAIAVLNMGLALFRKRSSRVVPG
jgi:hypothetical protein